MTTTKTTAMMRIRMAVMMKMASVGKCNKGPMLGKRRKNNSLATGMIKRLSLVIIEVVILQKNVILFQPIKQVTLIYNRAILNGLLNADWSEISTNNRIYSIV